jgi:hypothetical protein
MKKSFQVLVLLAGWFTGLLTGCSNPLQKPDNATPYQATTKVGSQYQAMLSLMTEYGNKSVDKLLEYTDIGNQEEPLHAIARSLQTANYVDIQDIEGMLNIQPNKIKTVGRVSRNAVSANEIGTDNIPLEEAFQEIANSFEAEMVRFKSDLSFWEGITGVEIKDGVVCLDDDITIDTHTPNGILTLELMKAQMEGRDVESIINDMRLVVNNYETPAQDRGLYKYSTNLWPNGRVNFAWGPISSLAKNAVKDAMRDWESKVSDITFVDKSDDWWHKFLAGIWLASYVKIEQDTSLSKPGEATVGRTAGVSSYKIRYGTQDDSNYKYRTPRHEPGHTLGLRHEHQRWDRDYYLACDRDHSDDPVNYEKIHDLLIK